MLKKIGMGALAALTIAGSTAAMMRVADARDFRHGGWRGGHHGYHGHHGWRGDHGHRGIGFFAPAFIGGLSLAGAATHYGYGSDCWIQRRVVIDQWGRQFVRPVRVCS